MTMDGTERQETTHNVGSKVAVGGGVAGHMPPINSKAPTEQLKEAYKTLLLLLGCSSIWLMCSYIDATYTPRDHSYIPSRSLIISYQWCMVGYASNLILTLMK